MPAFYVAPFTGAWVETSNQLKLCLPELQGFADTRSDSVPMVLNDYSKPYYAELNLD